jgi:hypothetical protein
VRAPKIISSLAAPARLAIRSLAVLAIALGVLAAGTWVGHRADPTWSRRRAAGLGARGLDRSLPFAMPWFAFTDSEGRSFTPDDMRGRVWVVALWLPGCASARSGGARGFAGAERSLDTAGVTRDVSWVSMVGAADAAGGWVRRRFAAERRAQVVVADSSSLMELTRDLGLARSEADLAELVFGTAQPLFVVDRAGMVRAAYDASDPDADELLAEELRSVGRGAP